MSIRLRLTLLYTAILALTLVAFSVALYFTLANVTEGVVQDGLEVEAQRIVSERSFSLQNVKAPNGPALPLTYVQTRDLNGTIIGKSFGYADFALPLDETRLARVVQGKPSLAIAWKETKRLMVYSAPVKQGNQIVGVIQVARSLADQDASLATLQRLLMIGCGVVPLLAFGIGWLLAGAALRPITRITATARTIGEQRAFDQRVQYNGPPDEVGTLAATFNGMLAALEGSFAQVRQSLHAQRRFVADASHELRTPLTTIRGNLDLLGRQPPIDPADRVAALQDTTGETDRMIRLVNNLFVLARADVGLSLRREVVALPPLLHAAVRQARLLAPERSITLVLVPNLAVCADPDALRQVLVALLDNARIHTAPDAAITIEASRQQNRVQISVRDSGPGIPHELLPQIFDRFVRGDPARTGEGAGLGLAIAKTLTEGMDGTLAAASEFGHGSVFTVELPVAQ